MEELQMASNKVDSTQDGGNCQGYLYRKSWPSSDAISLRLLVRLAGQTEVPVAAEVFFLAAKQRHLQVHLVGRAGFSCGVEVLVLSWLPCLEGGLEYTVSSVGECWRRRIFRKITARTTVWDRYREGVFRRGLRMYSNWEWVPKPNV